MFSSADNVRDAALQALELTSMVFVCVCVQVTQFAKMEKADVMEMTVDHLRNVHTALAARKSLGLLTFSSWILTSRRSSSHLRMR